MRVVCRYERTEKIKNLRWETGTIIPATLAPKYVLCTVCVATYLHAYLSVLLCLLCGGALHDRISLCQREVQFFQSYDQLLTDYMTDFEIDLSAVRSTLTSCLCGMACDLYAHMKLAVALVFLQDSKPPKDLYVEVRVLRDCGEIMTESGIVNLEANSTHFLRRVDVEQFIRQGLLEQIKH